MKNNVKRLKVRFYRAGIGPDAVSGSLIKNLLDARDIDGMAKPIELGEKSLQVRGITPSKDGKSIRAYVVRFRDDAPLSGARDNPKEHPIHLEVGHEIIERNHFVLFQERPGLEIVAFQPSLEGAHISNLAHYLTLLFGAGEAVHMDDVLTVDAYKALSGGGLIKSIEFRIAKPRSKKFAPDPNDEWTQDSIDFMKATGATTFSAKITTKEKSRGLLNTLNRLKMLMTSPQTKALRVRMSDSSHPIDLLADRVFQDITVEQEKGQVQSSTIWNAIENAKLRAQHQLDEYFGKGDEALH